MTATYNRFEDVPYQAWKLGGDIKILQKDSVPAPLFSGQAIGILPDTTTTNYAPGDDVPAWAWIWWLIGVIVAGVVFTAIYRLTIYDTFVILRSAPEGRTEDLPNGDKIYTAPDGSTYNWDHLTGQMTKLGGSTKLDIVTAIKYLAVVVVIIVVCYVAIKGTGGMKADYVKAKAKVKAITGRGGGGNAPNEAPTSEG